MSKKDSKKDTGRQFPENVSTKTKLVHWADQIVTKVMAEKGDKAKYTIASGITPSGTVHIGNFREIITVELVARALVDRGKKVRFIYSWDEYDVFRKVPKNMPNQEMLEKNLRRAIVDIPDPYGTEVSYARHHEVDVEKDIAKVGVFPEYLYQAKKYRNLEYVDGIRIALQNRKKIKEILDVYRDQELDDKWWPLSGYCPKCEKDNISFSDFDGNNKITLHCNDCKHEEVVDIRKAPFLKLPWRIDWPMRWAHEKVDFEPGGKDHSTVGGSYSTGQDIVKIYNWTAPTYEKYDFISIKGAGGKISSSEGNVITVGECLKIYEPEMVRWLFAGTRPKSEFAISFDLDVIKNYEEFDKCERIYFGKEKVKENKLDTQKRIYELSCVDKIPKKLPFQPSFRHLTTVLQIYSFNAKEVVEHYKNELKTKEDKARLEKRIECATNWLKMYAPEDFKYTIQENPKKAELSKEMKNAIVQTAELLKGKPLEEKELHNQFYRVSEDNDVQPNDFFKAIYLILVDKERGPKLANFIKILGEKKVADILERAL
jgi:lysyl-tRNA synthetase class 1